MSRRTTPDPKAEAFAAALDDPCQIDPDDDDMLAMTQIAGMISPAVTARPEWREAMKRHLRREMAPDHVSLPAASSGSRDGHNVPLYTAEVFDGTHGTFVLADIEDMAGERAQQVSVELFDTVSRAMLTKHDDQQ